MAKYRVISVEERADAKIALDTRVLVEKPDGEGGTIDKEIGHFTVIIEASDVLVLAALDKPERIQGYLALFSADSRISGIIQSEEAVAQMEADVTFPTAAIEV